MSRSANPPLNFLIHLLGMGYGDNFHMPDKLLHRDKQHRTQRALYNLQTSKSGSQHADWIVTLAFYKALHAVDSFLATKSIHPQGHKGRKGRNESVKQHLKKIYARYSALYSASINARYEDYTYQNKPQAVSDLLKNALYIENHINTLL